MPTCTLEPPKTMTRISPAPLITLALSALLCACGGDSDSSPAVDGMTSPDAHGDADVTIQEDVALSTDTAPDIGVGPVADADVAALGLPEETGPGLGIDWEAMEPGMAARYDPFSDDWIARGWPNDVLRRADGTLDLSNFPDPGIDLLDSYF